MATAFFLVDASIQTASQNYDALVAGRFIGGIAVAYVDYENIVVYFGDCTAYARRSLLVLEISIIIGAILAY